MARNVRLQTDPLVATNRIWRVITALLICGVLSAFAGLMPASSTEAAQTAAAGGILTVAYSAAPTSLDPATNNQATDWYDYPAYDALFRQDPNGKIVADLATSGKYVGKHNEVFDIALRSGVKFSDGTKLTAKGVKAWLAYFEKAKGPQATLIVGLKSITVKSKLKLRLTFTTPNPLLRYVLSQMWLAGDVVSPAALKDPSELGSRTFGAGPYMLDSAQTVTGDHYTYIPNPHYWDKKALHYHEIVIKVIANPSATLQALRTGQVSVAVGDPSTATAAKRSGLKVLGAPQLFEGLDLTDRSGKIVKALRNVGVRRAINYALDRKAIAKATVPTGGLASDEVSVPGLDGWSPSYRNFYPYNVKKAKALMKVGGYAKGFNLRVLATPLVGLDLGAEAIAGDLKRIGINVQLTDDATVGQYVGDLVGGKFPAVEIGYGGLPMYMEGPSLYLKNAAVFNPLHSYDGQIAKWWTKAAGAPATQQKVLYRRIENRLITQAWFAISTVSPLFYYTTPGIRGVVAKAGYIPNLVEFAPK